MPDSLSVGIIGCGNISAAYLKLAPNFKGMRIAACADISESAARARAEEYGIQAKPVEDLLSDPSIDIVVNLTIPAAHFEVTKSILEAGKHAYSEKPFALSLEQGKELGKAAREKSLRIGSAPDTFMGGAHQLARLAVDSGKIGRVATGACFVQSPGMEMWHPNPDFFFQPGGGPVLDLGPYYVSNLVQLLGPVRRVGAIGKKVSERRTITSEPRRGEIIKVEIPTTFHSILEFESGALVTYVTSWDVWQHGHSSMELYGDQGTLHVPDPNFFGGEVRMTLRDSFVNGLPGWDHPLSVPNHGSQANYRGIGLAEMARAIMEGRQHRCSFEFALHAVDVMTAIIRSSETGQFLDIETSCERPEPFGPEDARSLMAKEGEAP